MAKIEWIICTFFLLGYALDPSLDNHQVSTKYIGSVEEAEKNQGNLFEIFSIKYICISLLSFSLTLDSRKKLVFYLALDFFFF